MIVDVEKFRAAYERLRKRTFFRTTATQFEQYPRYCDAVEYAFDQLAPSLTLAYRPGHIASQIALAAFLARAESVEDPPLPPVPDGQLDRIIAAWRNPQKKDAEQDFLGFWSKIRDRAVEHDTELQPLTHAIEEIVRNEESIDASDRKLILFAVGVFLCVILDSRIATDALIDDLINASSPRSPR